MLERDCKTPKQLSWMKKARTHLYTVTHSGSLSVWAEVVGISPKWGTNRIFSVVALWQWQDWILPYPTLKGKCQASNPRAKFAEPPVTWCRLLRRRYFDQVVSGRVPLLRLITFFPSHHLLVFVLCFLCRSRVYERSRRLLPGLQLGHGVHYYLYLTDDSFSSIPVQLGGSRTVVLLSSSFHGSFLLYLSAIGRSLLEVLGERRPHRPGGAIRPSRQRRLHVHLDAA